MKNWQRRSHLTVCTAVFEVLALEILKSKFDSVIYMIGYFTYK